MKKSTLVSIIAIGLIIVAGIVPSNKVALFFMGFAVIILAVAVILNKKEDESSN